MLCVFPCFQCLGWQMMARKITLVGFTLASCALLFHDSDESCLMFFVESEFLANKSEDVFLMSLFVSSFVWIHGMILNSSSYWNVVPWIQFENSCLSSWSPESSKGFGFWGFWSSWPLCCFKPAEVLDLLWTDVHLSWCMFLNLVGALFASQWICVFGCHNWCSIVL